MAEYIEREAAQKVAERYGCTSGATLGRHSGLADCIASEIELLPAANVAPVRHGKWVKQEDYSCCSECGQPIVDDCIPWFKFCANCGAKMDGGGDG